MNWIILSDGFIFTVELPWWIFTIGEKVSNKMTEEGFDIATDMDALRGRPTAESVAKEILELVEAIIIKWETYQALHSASTFLQGEKLSKTTSND